MTVHLLSLLCSHGLTTIHSVSLNKILLVLVPELLNLTHVLQSMCMALLSYCCQTLLHSCQIITTLPREEMRIYTRTYSRRRRKEIFSTTTKAHENYVVSPPFNSVYVILVLYSRNITCHIGNLKFSSSHIKKNSAINFNNVFDLTQYI